MKEKLMDVLSNPLNEVGVKIYDISFEKEDGIDTLFIKIDSDKFTVSTSTGNGKLIYPIALMTADEIKFAGGLVLNDATSWYYYNSANGSSTGSTFWWLLSPHYWTGSYASVFRMGGSSVPGYLNGNGVYSAEAVRPAVSLKSCIKYSTGNGSASDPYTIKETASGC